MLEHHKHWVHVLNVHKLFKTEIMINLVQNSSNKLPFFFSFKGINTFNVASAIIRFKAKPIMGKVSFYFLIKSERN